MSLKNDNCRKKFFTQQAIINEVKNNNTIDNTNTLLNSSLKFLNNKTKENVLSNNRRKVMSVLSGNESYKNYFKKIDNTRRSVKNIHKVYLPTNFSLNEKKAKKIFLKELTIKKGIKEKRIEMDIKKNSLFLEKWSDDDIIKLKENCKNIFDANYHKKIFSNDASDVITAISELNEILENPDYFDKIDDNLDIIIKIIYLNLSLNHSGSLIKVSFRFLEKIIYLYKKMKKNISDIEMSIILNIYSDKLVNLNFKDQASSLILFLVDTIGHYKCIIILVNIWEFKNAKSKTELIDLIRKIYDDHNCSKDKSKENINMMNKIIKILIKFFFDADFNLKNKILLFLNDAYILLKDDFWKMIKFLPSKKIDEIKKKISELQETNTNNNVKEITSQKNNIKNSNSSCKMFPSKGKMMNKKSNKSILKPLNKFPKVNARKKLLTTKTIKTAKQIDLRSSKNILKKHSLIPSSIKFNNIKQNNNILTQEEIITLLNSLNGNDNQIVESILKIYNLMYINYEKNKEIILNNANKIFITFNKLINSLMTTEQTKIKIIKYSSNVLSKIANIKELISKIKMTTQEELIRITFEFIVLYSNISKIKDKVELEIILKNFNTIMLHIIDNCDITNNIIIIVRLMTRNSIKTNYNLKLIEYGSKCLNIISKNIKIFYKKMNLSDCLKEIDLFLIEYENIHPGFYFRTDVEENIVNCLKNLVKQFIFCKKEYIIEDYINGIEVNGIPDVYVKKWIQEELDKNNNESFASEDNNSKKSDCNIEHNINEYINGDLLNNVVLDNEK